MILRQPVCVLFFLRSNRKKRIEHVGTKTVYDSEGVLLMRTPSEHYFPWRFAELGCVRIWRIRFQMFS